MSITEDLKLFKHLSGYWLPSGNKYCKVGTWRHWFLAFICLSKHCRSQQYLESKQEVNIHQCMCSMVYLAIASACFQSICKKWFLVKYSLKIIWQALTLKWPRYFYYRWCPRGGGSMEPPWENHFPTGILQWNLHHICTGHKKSQFCKKKFKMLYRFKMAAK